MNQPNRHHPPRQETPIDVRDIRLGSIDEKLYADIAEAKARFLAEHSKREINKSAQLRRFYDELALWNEKVNGKGAANEREKRYQELAPLIKMLNAKVVYAKGRNHVDKDFVTLFRHLLAQIKDPRTLEQAKLFMEAFMGFYKAYKG
jgi:CRISPR-associated protein Csm2